VLTSATGTAWERTPWHATQRVAWEALKKKPESESGQEEREWKKSSTTYGGSSMSG